MKSIELKRRNPLGRRRCVGKNLLRKNLRLCRRREWELLHRNGIVRKNWEKPTISPRSCGMPLQENAELGEQLTLDFWPAKLGRTSIQYSFEFIWKENPTKQQPQAASRSLSCAIKSPPKFRLKSGLPSRLAIPDSRFRLALVAVFWR